MQEWNDLPRQTPIALWEAGVQRKGRASLDGVAGRFEALAHESGQSQEPSHRALRAYPSRGLSFLGRRYVSPGLLDRLRGKEIDIYYDRRDISVIYLFLEGELVGEAYCTEFMGRRVSIWEATANAEPICAQAKEATARSLASRQTNSAKKPLQAAVHSLETKRLEKQRQLDLQRQEIHPSHVQATLQALKEQQTPSSLPSQKAQVFFLQPSQKMIRQAQQSSICREKIEERG